MYRRFFPRFSLLILLPLFVLLLSACNRDTNPSVAPAAPATTSASQVANPDTTTEAVPLTGEAASTAEAVLQEAVAALQASSDEEPVSAAGGAEGRSGVGPTATAPVLTEGPSAAITPATGSANTQATITGSGFPANVRVDVYLAGLVRASAGREAPHSYANTTTDRDGNYRVALCSRATGPAVSRC